MLIKNLLGFFTCIYFVAMIAAGNDATRSRSWQRETDTHKVVFQSPWTYPVCLTMFGLMFLIAAVFPIFAMRFPIPGIVFVQHDQTSDGIVLAVWLLLCGGLAQLIFSISSTQYLVIDLEQRTYRNTFRKWLVREYRTGSLDDIVGIYCRSRGTLSLMTRKRPSTSCGTLAICPNQEIAMAEAERLSVLLQLPVLGTNWRPFP
jgi:hypothetical protein